MGTLGRIDVDDPAANAECSRVLDGADRVVAAVGQPPNEIVSVDVRARHHVVTRSIEVFGRHELPHQRVGCEDEPANAVGLLREVIERAETLHHCADIR